MNIGTNPNRPLDYLGLWFCGLLLLMALGVVPVAHAISGIDGALTVSSANTQINRYAPVTAISGNTVTVTDITLLNRSDPLHFTNNALSPGDLILLYQAQGATFTDTTNAATWGAFNVQNAGLFEFAEVLYTTGNTIVLCANVVNTYTISGRVQVVRVPQYTALTIDNGASVVGAAWNGTSGGIVALNVSGTLTVNGQVSVDSQGFRGGARNTNGTLPGSTIYRTTDATLGAQKGESILGFGTEYDAAGGQYGRGAPANGGGGGDAHNASGGGGANGNNGGTWTGAGDPDLTTTAWRCAWDLDDGVDDGTANNANCTNPTNMGVIPTYFSNGAGGGRGGYTYGANNSNALTSSAGNTAWGGDNRRQVGGLGGRPLANDPASRLFFGGGGGGGDNNPAGNTGTDGAPGGGLILIDASSLTGTGTLSANGGTVTANAGNDGSGGGGGGGTIVVRTSNAPSTTITLRATGGRGGNQVISGNESEGPGGGGGGGYIRISVGAASAILILAMTP